MKTASVPTVNVHPSLLNAARPVLRRGESLSRFVACAIEEAIQRRQSEDAFRARGMRSLAEARRTNTYVSSAEVVSGLTQMLVDAKAKAQR